MMPVLLLTIIAVMMRFIAGLMLKFLKIEDNMNITLVEFNGNQIKFHTKNNGITKLRLETDDAPWRNKIINCIKALTLQANVPTTTPKITYEELESSYLKLSIENAILKATIKNCELY